MEPLLKLIYKFNNLKNDGKIVYNLGIGDPDFKTPKPILKYCYNMMKNGKTHYTDSSGMPLLKSAIANNIMQKYNAQYNDQNIVISHGAKLSIYNIYDIVMQNKNDTAILLSPYWFGFKSILDHLKKPFKIVKSNDDFSINKDNLEKAITKSTKIIIVNTPNNPTGKIISPKCIESLSIVLNKNPDLKIILDIVYDDIIFNGSLDHIGKFIKKFKNRIFIVGSFSKNYAMTGFRIGFCISDNNDFVNALSKRQLASITCPSIISQHAAYFAMSNNLGIMDIYGHIIKKNIDYIQNSPLKSIPIDAGVFANIDIKNIIDKNNKIENDVDFCHFLLDNYLVMTCPGSISENSGYIRICISKKYSDFKAAYDKIITAIKDLKGAKANNE